MPNSYLLLMLRDAPVPAEELLAGTGLNLSDLDSGQAISVADQFRVLQNYGAAMDDPEWVFHFGRRLGINSHGPLGFGAVSAPSLAEGLAFLSRYTAIRAPFLSSHIDAASDGLLLVMELESVPESIELMIVITLVVQAYIEMVLGEEMSLARIRLPLKQFMGRKPVKTLQKISREWLHGDLQFFGDTWSVWIPEHWGQRVNPYFNEDMYQSALQQCEAAIDHNHLAARVALVLNRAYVQASAGKSVQIPDSALLAEQMDISRRTLIRRLKQEGTTFRQIRDAVMLERLKALLRASDLSIGEIGHRLGYGDQTNFTRACQRLTGTTPAAYRKQLRQDDTNSG